MSQAGDKAVILYLPLSSGYTRLDVGFWKLTTITGTRYKYRAICLSEQWLEIDETLSYLLKGYDLCNFYYRGYIASL